LHVAVDHNDPNLLHVPPKLVEANLVTTGGAREADGVKMATVGDLFGLRENWPGNGSASS